MTNINNDVRVFAGSFKQAEEIAILLLSEGIYAEYRANPAEWVVIINKNDLERSINLILQYRRDEKKEENTEAEASNNLGLIISGFLVTFFILAGPFDRGNMYFRFGAIDRKNVIEGEVWRAFTALTMHGDIMHLAGNIAALLLFGSAVSQIIGANRAWLLILLTGITGNLAKVLLHSYQYHSIGASTAVFGAVGLLGGLGFLRQKKRNARGAWLSIAASVMLLVLLGSNPNADVLAHLYGFLSGLIFATFIRQPVKVKVKGETF